jgi:RNA polymerase sigma factor (sigma-70 family)
MSRSERDGQDAWIRSAVGRFEAPLVAYARSLLGDLHAAEDVVQDAFLRLHGQDPARLNGCLRPWLYRVCRNAATDVLRRRRIMPRTNAATLDGPATPDASVERRDAAARALAAVEELPATQREATVLRLRHGLAYREIAEVMGTTPSHVGVLLHDAMTALRRRLANRPEGGPR